MALEQYRINPKIDDAWVQHLLDTDEHFMSNIWTVLDDLDDERREDVMMFVQLLEKMRQVHLVIFEKVEPKVDPNQLTIGDA